MCRCIHKGYFVVKNWCEMFVLKLSGIQIIIHNIWYLEMRFCIIFNVQMKIYFANQKYFIPTLKTCFSTTKYSLIMLMCTENAAFKNVWFTNIKKHQIYFEKDKTILIWGLKCPPYNNFFWPLIRIYRLFLNKSDAKLYISK